MARQKVKLGGDLRFVNPSKLAEEGINGLILKGTYLGPIKNERFGGTDEKFEDLEGKTVIINGCGSLNAAMAKVDPGSLVEVEYAGTKEITSGNFKGKMAHQFDVFLDV